MSCRGKNTERNETGRAVRRQRQTDAEMCLLDSSYISSQFNYTCNKTLPKGISPDRLNYSIIKPLYTKGNKHDVSNYRLTYLPTSLSKLFGKIMPSRFKGDLTKYNILSMEKYGFRTNLTRRNATYTLTNVISNAMNNKLAVGCIFCDIEKAFDCINHDILLPKMEFYGVEKKKTLYKYYLSNRYQRVSINNKKYSSMILYKESQINTVCHKVPSWEHCYFSYI